VKYIDKPIEPTRHYFLFQDSSAGVVGMFNNGGGVFAFPNSFVITCPDGYELSTFSVPEYDSRQCYKSGSDRPRCIGYVLQAA
jgi:hypothetical protein